MKLYKHIAGINRKSVLVTDANNKHTLSIVRSLGRKGLTIYCGSSSALVPVSSFSGYAAQTFIYPDPRESADLFEVFIKKIIEKLNISVIIPVGYSTTFSLSRIKNKIKNTQIPVADFESLSIAASKKSTISLAEKIGVPTPKTIIPDSLSDLEKQALGYPLVVKGARESGYVRYVNNIQDLKGSVSEIYRQQGESPLVQEYIHGMGHGFFALFNKGRPRAIFMHKRVREYPLAGGPSTCAESIYEPKLLRYGLKLLKALSWHGVAMVEFRKDFRDEDFKLMEINPKFWGSLDLAIASGVDFPHLLYEMAVTGDLKPVFSYKVGVRFMWPFPDDFLRVIDMPSNIIPFLLDFFNPTVGKNIDSDDLSPNIMQLMGTAYQLILRFRGNR